MGPKLGHKGPKPSQNTGGLKPGIRRFMDLKGLKPGLGHLKPFLGASSQALGPQARLQGLKPLTRGLKPGIRGFKPSLNGVRARPPTRPWESLARLQSI